MSWIRRETEKGAVQYICPHCHDYHEFREDFGGRTFGENYIFCRRCGARNGTGNAPTLTPPNEPMTLEQLREMDGEPVYLIVDDGYEPLEMWALIDVPEKDHIVLINNIGGRSAYYSDDDLERDHITAYRRPPEGEEETP